MIDVIIPAYNAHETIAKTLSSLALQSISYLMKVYVVDDCSKEGYSKILKTFKSKLKISELRTSKNGGPGAARQFGLEHSNSDYIMFIDADDFLYNSKTLELLYNTILEGYDLVYGYDFEESDTGFGINKKNVGSLHGKLYSRSHLKKYNIKFNDTKYSEDNSFNQIFLWTSTNYKALDEITHIYSKNINSITHAPNKEVEIMAYYAVNTIYTLSELEKRDIPIEYLVDILLTNYVYLFKWVGKHDDYDMSDIYKLGYELEEYYDKYCDYIYPDIVFNHIKDNIYCDDIFKDLALKQFNDFRSNFVKTKKSSVKKTTIKKETIKKTTSKKTTMKEGKKK